ncbi:hypothetical protein J7E91_20475 [Streptomyces sp. ISL-99]|uniref:hypothetical protein n=1 Tax=Streptomyces sp. ISL-99 TaxID=2819193 RepID=UPI001BE8BF51|nr:hypothetical protein [Streptomyces sp. ISL-99]MBT2527735.1 hypothetical protein [Streptomyces sp. ISL-99]
MISEPEMVGDFAAWPEPETSTSEDRPPAPRGRRPWLWAVGGAVAASVVWAGGLYTYAPWGAVDTRGYRVGEGLCDKVRLTALSLNLGKKSEDPLEVVGEDSALDTATCGFAFEPTGKPAKGEPTVSYEVLLGVELHKKSDPGPEFEAVMKQPRWGDVVPPKMDAIVSPGLGEKAFLTVPGEVAGMRLKVLDGGAVFDLQVIPTMGYGDEEPPLDENDSEPDTAPLQVPMIEDMRDLMAALKSQPTPHV